MEDEKPYWFPVPCDKAHCDQLREDYEEYKNWSDEELIDHFDYGRRYSVTWDHIGDALDDWEPAADHLLKIREGVDKAIRRLDAGDLDEWSIKAMADMLRETIRL